MKLQRIFSLFATIIVFGLALCSKASFLLLITLSHEGAMTLLPEQKPLALLCIGCSLIAPSVLVLLKSIWKTCVKTSKMPRKTTAATVLFFEFCVSVGVAGLTIAVMPHLDILTNVAVLNTAAVLPVLLQSFSQCIAKRRNSFLVAFIVTFFSIFVGYCLLLVLTILKNPNDVKMDICVGLAVGGTILVSFNWWENYLKLICENNSSVFFKDLMKDMTRSQNILQIISSIIRIVVTTCVLVACVPLAKTDWEIVTFIPDHQERILLIITGFQLTSSTLCHCFASAACKIQMIRRCFIPVLYLTSLAVLALLIIPVSHYYQDVRINLDTTESINLTSYCHAPLMDERYPSLSGKMFLQLVLDITQTLHYMDMSNIGLMTGVVVSWWFVLGLANFYIWYFKTHCMHKTQNQFLKSSYDGVFIEHSLLLNSQFGIQTPNRTNHFRENTNAAMVYLCTTMWHETNDEMKNNVSSMFSLDRSRPKTEPQLEDFTFEAHIYFDDAFENDGHRGRRLNKYAKNLVKIISEVYVSFIKTDETFPGNQEQIPDWKILKTPYGGRLVIAMPHGNDFLVHFKDKELIRNKKRWTQVMYLYYILDWKLTQQKPDFQDGHNENDIADEILKQKKNTYILVLDGDTYLQTTDLKILIAHMNMYPRVGSVSGRVHPIGTGPVFWFQKFEFAVDNWLRKTTEHAFGCLLCTPGSCSLLRAEALMDGNVMENFSTKSTKPKHYIQYDQGEDRWLTSLLLRHGWTVEYVAASHSYSTVPQTLKEFYNQRRRWMPTTLMNTVDLLVLNYNISKRKFPMSKLFIVYELFVFFLYIVTPACTSFCVAESLSFLFNFHFAVALGIIVIPPAIYAVLCFKLKEDTQIIIAAVLSLLYAFLMLVLIMIPIGSMVKGQTFLTPSSVFVVPTFFHFIVTAIVHTRDFSMVFYAWFYIISLPSFDIMLFFYTVINMNCIHWGTRELNPDDAINPAVISQPTKAQKCWMKTLQGLSRDVKLQEDSLSEEEENYWKELRDEHLQPFHHDKETIEKTQNDLRRFRNKMSFWFFFGNALWLLVLFTIKTCEISPSLIHIYVNTEETGGIFRAEFVGLTFFLGPAMMVLIQFIGMLWYRAHTIIDYIASCDNESEQQTWKKKLS